MFNLLDSYNLYLYINITSVLYQILLKKSIVSEKIRNLEKLLKLKDKPAVMDSNKGILQSYAFHHLSHCPV